MSLNVRFDSSIVVVADVEHFFIHGYSFSCYVSALFARSIVIRTVV